MIHVAGDLGIDVSIQERRFLCLFAICDISGDLMRRGSQFNRDL